MTQASEQTELSVGRVEFILLMAAMVALDAFSIDAMLPALSQIGDDLGLVVENHRQYVVTSIFIGFSIGVLLYGFFADRYGRRSPVLAGFIVYIAGSLACILAQSFPVLLAGRILQGLGAAGPYVLSVAIVRDLFKGREMAQILSLIMMVFIGVPMIAPFVGQGVLLMAGWRSIFLVLMLFSVITLIWFWWRQTETLPPQHRQPLTLHVVGGSIMEVLTNRQCVANIAALAAVSGAFIAYLSTGQQVFQDIYGLGNLFPVVFASLASLFGVASWLNSRLVESIGSRRLVHRALSVVVLASIVFLVSHTVSGQHPALWSYILYIALIMPSFAFLFGNLTSLALEPMGHIAGAASSIVSSLSTAVAILLATITGSYLHDQVYPIVAGFGLLCAIAWLLNYQQLQQRR